MATGPSIASIIFAVLGMAVLMASGWWTNRRYSRFDRLPVGYDFDGQVNRMEPRRLAAWLVPVLFSLVIALFIVLQSVLPPEFRSRDRSTPLYVIPVVLIAAQGCFLWLLDRWARRQPHG